VNSLTSQTMQEDVTLRQSSEDLWETSDGGPEIRQIFGHFLPPQHMKIVDGLVAKDFNFPAVYHSARDVCSLACLHSIGEKLNATTAVALAPGVVIREEPSGAVLSTPYHNGFWVNTRGAEILGKCRELTNVEDLATATRGLEFEKTLIFIARCVTLGIINVHAT